MHSLIEELNGKQARLNLQLIILLKKSLLLFNLAELQAECSKKFKINPDETLQVSGSV